MNEEDQSPVAINPDGIRKNYDERKYDPGKLSIPQRVSQAAFVESDGQCLEAALKVCEGSLRTVRQAHPSAQRGEIHTAEAEACRQWALKNYLLIPEEDFTRKWEADGRRGESEHQVYFLPATQFWWKRNTLNFHNGSISAYLERIAIQKFLFPELTLKFEGFSEYRGGLLPVISQADAAGSAPTDEQIRIHLQHLGFREIFETGKGMMKAHRLAVEAGLGPPDLGLPRRVGFYLASEGIWLEDVHDENAVLSPEGDINVFDPVAYFIDSGRMDKLIAGSSPLPG